MRGFVSGVIWGGVVATLGLAVVSQLVPLQGQGLETTAVSSDADAIAAPVTPTAPAVDTAENSAAQPAQPAAVLPADSPNALATAPDAPSLATASNEATEVTPAADPVNEASAPDAPPLIASDSLPAAPDLPPVPPLTDGEMALALAEAGVEIVPPEGMAEGAPAQDPAAAPELSAPNAEALPVETPQTDALPLDDAAQDGLPDNAVLPEEAGPPEPVPPQPESAEPAVPTEPLLDAPTRPTTGFSDATGVTTGRLPSIAPATQTSEAEIAAVAEPAAETPLRRFAAEFANPSAKPLFSIILIDSGTTKLNRVALAEIPLPVTFAIDPSLQDAEKIAAIYRAAGKEVVMLATGLPKGAKASDIEVTFQSNAAAMPEATAVLDLEQGGFQGDRPLATLVVPVIKGQGRGLITWDRGLNAATQVAQRENVPRGLVFRRIDAEGESVSTMRRYLDRAAFKAAQDGRVAVVGTTDPDTVTALMEWSVEGRAASVALAPVSALLVSE